MSRRESFAVQLDNQRSGPAGRRGSTYAQRLSLAEHVGTATDEVTAPFTSTFAPSEMRQLALVAHNHMKPAMKQFIETYSEILKKFRITGTQTTMKMCKSMWGEVHVWSSWRCPDCGIDVYGGFGRHDLLC